MIAEKDVLIIFKKTHNWKFPLIIFKRKEKRIITEKIPLIIFPNKIMKNLKNIITEKSPLIMFSNKIIKS